jgi:16S rRNA (cytidine1402-2'-O)-methyltransferase
MEAVMAAMLYIVATPIGNLEDITLRALRVLKEVDVIAAEDTRHTRILLDHYDIHAPLVSYHEHNEKDQAPRLVERMKNGESLALVSDAGTPAISDPGYRLVAEALRAGILVTPVPGASAVISALSASGLPTDRFVFEGFLPAKKGERERRIELLCKERRTLVFYEAPHRLKDSLAEMRRILGNRDIAVARELSKVHEEFLRGTIDEVAEMLADREVKGEVTIIVRGAQESAQISSEELAREIRSMLGDGLSVKAISEQLAEYHHIPRREIYQLALRLKAAKPAD